MTVSLRNTSGGSLTLGVTEGRYVDADEVIHVEGELAPKKDQPDDGIVVVANGEARAYPTSLWTNVGGPKNAKPDVIAPSKESI